MIKRTLGMLNLWLVIGACLLCSTPTAIINTLRPLMDGQQTEGVITEVLSGTRYDPLSVRVRFEAPTVGVITTTAQGLPLWPYREGQQVTVAYLPDRPGRVYLREQLRFGAAVLLVVGGLFGGIPLWFGLRKARASATAARG